jgi:DNA-binding MarR family transcriptional regulator
MGMANLAEISPAARVLVSRSLMPKTDEAARRLLEVVMLVMRTVAADMRTSPRPLAPPQMGSLMRLATGPCTMSELARAQFVRLPTISKSVGMLVERGYVERWVDTRNRRQTMVALTPDGRKTLARIKQRTERLVTRTLAPLNPSERAQLVAGLDVLRRVLGKCES